MSSLENLNNQKMMIRKPNHDEKKPLMQLKDYLLDDLSSCSSNGFKSFPRKRQCFTTVRFLLDIDLKQNNTPRLLHRGRRSNGHSILRRASDAVVSAVKLLPYRRFLRKSRFWGRSDGGGCEKQLRLQRCGPSDRSEFGSSLRSVENDIVVGGENDVSFLETKKEDDTIVGGEDSSTEAETTVVKEWPNEEEKEQFSPVSILDCPFEDDDDNDDQPSSPNFHHKLGCLEGTHKQKIRRFENLTQLEPIDLEKRITMSELEENKLDTLSIQKDVDHDQRNKIEVKARELMKLVKSKNNYLCSKAENLMFDFFKERVTEGNEKEGLKVMDDWVNGKKIEMWLGWEVKQGRKAYVKEMEKGGKWKEFENEIQEIDFDLEASIWDSLVDELLVGFLCS